MIDLDISLMPEQKSAAEDDGKEISLCGYLVIN